MEPERIEDLRLIESIYRYVDDAMAALQIERPDVARRRLAHVLRNIEEKRPALALPPQQRNSGRE